MTRADVHFRIVAAALYTMAFLVVASALIRAYGFPLDDSYIYQVIARSLAFPARLSGYTLGKPFAGATSVLWVLVQSARYRWLSMIDPIQFNLVLNWFLLISIGQLLASVALADGLSLWKKWILVLSPALCGNLCWLGLIGMEHLLFLVLSLLVLWLWFSERPRAAIYAGLVAGVLPLVRPEGALLGLLILSTAIQHRRSARWLSFASLWLLGCATFALINLAISGSILPSTLQGRTWLYFHSTYGPHTLKAILGLPGMWIRRLPQLISIHFVSTTLRFTHGNIAFTVTAAILTALALLGFAVLFQSAGRRVRTLMAWAVLHAATFLIALPVTGHGGRYQPEILLLAFPVMFTGVVWIVEQLSMPPTAIKTVTVGLLAVVGLTSLFSWRSVSILSIQHIQNTHGKIANWIQQNLATDDRIAAFDSGYIAYRLERPLTDLGGLIDPAAFRALQDNTVPDYLQAHQIEYVVLPHQDREDDNLRILNAAQARTLVESCTPYDTWQTEYAFTMNAWRCQRLLKIDRTRR